MIPSINQIEFNPYVVDNDILDACKTNGIVVQAYSPLGCGTGVSVRQIEGNIDRGSSQWYHTLSDNISLINEFGYQVL